MEVFRSDTGWGLSAMAGKYKDLDIHDRLAMAEAALGAIGQKTSSAIDELDIAVTIPCHNEAATIAGVVRNFQAALPMARIYVYDNNSTDNTAGIARDAGAIVRREPLQGKGHVVRRMFADIEADIYLMVDGDGTYDAAAAPRMVSRLIETGADMVVGARITEDKAAYRTGHRFGNAMLTGTVSKIFGERTTDMLSGYRAVSRRFAKSYPAAASGFGTETELTVYALELDMIIAEIHATYSARPDRCVSKRTMFGDGLRTLKTIGQLTRDERPLAFFGSLSLLAALASLGLGVPVVMEFLQTGAVDRFPTAFLSGFLAVLAAVGLVSGVILKTVARGRREMKRLQYNQIESLTAKLERLAETRSQMNDIRMGARAERQRQDLTRDMPRRTAVN
mgnify:CR=1 FL=1